MSMCRVFSCVVGRRYLLWPVCSLGRTLLAFVLLHSIVQDQICLLLLVSWLPTFAFQSPIMNIHININMYIYVCVCQETLVQSLGWEDPLEEGMATHSSILAWRIPGTEKRGGLPSMGSHKVRRDWSDLAATAAVVDILIHFLGILEKKIPEVGFLY